MKRWVLIPFLLWMIAVAAIALQGVGEAMSRKSRMTVVDSIGTAFIDGVPHDVDHRLVAAVPGSSLRPLWIRTSLEFTPVDDGDRRFVW